MRPISPSLPVVLRLRLIPIVATALSLGLPATPAAAEFAIPDYELVHNAPAGTTLATPDLRDAATVWCDMIGRARHEIDFEQFYVAGKPGEALDRVIAAMEAAGRRGVRIRFLMERKGLSESDAATIERLKRIPNLDFRLLAWSDVSGSGIIHAKFFMVDGHEAYVGSQNFDWRSLNQIDETGLRVTDAVMIGQMQRIFEQDWRAQAVLAAGGHVPPLRSADPAPIDGRAFLVASPNAFDPPDVGDSQASLVKLIAAARHDIRVEVMEYGTTAFGGGEYHVIDDALRAAARRGVRVRLMVADWDLTPSRLPGLIALASVPNVEIRVSRIPQPPSGFIPYARVSHTKVMTIDGGLAWIGTSNWEGGYLDTSRNLEVVLRDRAMADRVSALQEQMWTSPYAMSLADARKLPPVHPGGQG